MLRYHGRWILTKKKRFYFFAVRIEETVINILQKKMSKKAFLLFEIQKEIDFLKARFR